MNKRRVALLTEEKYIHPRETNWYIDQLLLEDRLLIEALEKRGAQVTKVGWTKKDIDFSTFDAAVFSSIWDYYHYPEAFAQWLNRVEGHTTFFNPIATIRDNMDKRYLVRFQKAGREVVPTIYLPKGSEWGEKDWAKQLDSNRLVIKPIVGGAAVDTFQWKISDAGFDRTAVKKILDKKAMIVQPFIASVQDMGEVSHIFFDGIYSHSVLKRPKTGDYRVQDDHGGSVEPYAASSAEIKNAGSWLSLVDELPVYARVDLVWGEMGKWLLGELELIEPELWLRLEPLAADAFARAVFRRLK
jgi:hypothetical protein